MTDHELLCAYADNGSDTAFAELVRRYVGLVHSAAQRQVLDPHLAEEITQAVFVVLARKAGRLGANTVLAGWLLKATSYTAQVQIRTKIRRAQREQEAAMQSILNEPDYAAWEQLAPHLDAAMSILGDADRNAIALRYFENKTAGEIAAALKVNEEAAQKRVARALEKLRKIFSTRGVTLTVTVLTAAISANSVQAAPLGLAATVTATVAKGAVVSGSTLTLIKGALKIMAWTKMKTAIVVGVGVLLTAGTATVVTKTITSKLHPTSADSVFEEIWAHPEASISATLDQAPAALKLRPTHFPKMGQGIWSGSGSGRCVWVNASIPFLVGIAYDRAETRMVFPDGMSREGFDYINTLPERVQKTELKAEVEQRFGLVAHTEPREMDVLLLQVKDAAKLQSHLTKGGRFENYGMGDGKTQKRVCKNAALSCITGEVEAYFQKPTLDRTGTKQHYDLEIQWTERKWSSSAERRKAVQSVLINQLDQLGLELVPSREPVEMLVVEKVK